MARNNKLELDSSGIGTWSTADGRFSIVRRVMPINPMEATANFKIRTEYSIHSFEDYDGPTQHPQLAPEIGRVNTFKEVFPWLGEYTGEGSFELGNPSLIEPKVPGARHSSCFHESTASVAPQWVKNAARSDNVKGPNGNTAVAYEWRWKQGVKWSKSEDGLVSVKESDWDNFERCKSCNRKIVHVYWVKTPDGKIQPYGGDHLHVALGYPRELSKPKLKAIQNKVTHKEFAKKEAEYALRNYQKYVDMRASKSIRDANIKFMKSGGKRGASPVFLVNRKKKLVMRGDDLFLERFFQHMPGWEIVNSGTEARKLIESSALQSIDGNRNIEETMDVLKDVFCEAKFLPKNFVLGVQGWWDNWRKKWKHIDAKDLNEFVKVGNDLLDEAIHSFRELEMYLRNEHGYWDEDDFHIGNDPRRIVKSLLHSAINSLGNGAWELLNTIEDMAASGGITMRQAISKMVKFVKDLELDYVGTLIGILKTRDKVQPTSFDRVEQKFDIGKVKFLVQFLDKYEVSKEHNPHFNPSKIVPMLSKAGDMAMQLMRRAGLDFMWKGKVWVGPRGEGYPNPIARQRIKSGERKVLGFYSPKSDQIVLYPGNQPWAVHSEIAYTLIHEIAHRYWHKHLSRERREQFIKWFGTVSATSDYGSTSPKEDFSETMAEYILHPSRLSKSQRDRLVQIVKLGGKFVQHYEDKSILEDVFSRSL